MVKIKKVFEIIVNEVKDKYSMPYLGLRIDNLNSEDKITLKEKKGIFKFRNDYLILKKSNKQEKWSKECVDCYFRNIEVDCTSIRPFVRCNLLDLKNRYHFEKLSEYEKLFLELEEE